MKLAELIDQDGEFDARFAALEVTGVASDSRKVKRGDLFVAVPGAKADGLTFVAQALAAGAVAVMAERAPENLPRGSRLCAPPMCAVRSRWRPRDSIRASRA